MVCDALCYPVKHLKLIARIFVFKSAIFVTVETFVANGLR